jgi:hypothetical protein
MDASNDASKVQLNVDRAMQAARTNQDAIKSLQKFVAQKNDDEARI